MEIIDFHTHPFLDHNKNFCHYKASMSMDEHTFLSDMDEAGVSVFCGSVIKKTEDFEELRECNREALKLRDIYGNRYQPGFHVHPDYIYESVQEINLAKDNGVRIIGELVPYMNGWRDYSCKGFYSILDEIEKYKMVVSLHTIDLKQMSMMAEAHKNVNFIFAHPGEKANVDEHMRIMKRLDNVYLDLSGTGLFRYGLVRHLANGVGAERILFGTDYPICNLPMYINAVLGEKLSDRERELIFSANARRLLNL